MKRMDIPEEFLQEPEMEDYEEFDDFEDMEINEKDVEKEIKYYIG